MNCYYINFYKELISRWNMEENFDFSNIDYETPEFGEILYETSKFGKIIYELMQINKNGDEYSRMPLEKLSELYDKIEDGLIGFNLVAKDISNLMNGEELIYGEDGLGRFLESQLLSIVASVTIRNPSHYILQKFRSSLWKDKFKDREYYEKVFELAGIKEEEMDKIYSSLQN
jgi:hypothetical protein